jgi:hypothetical protein
VGAGVGRVTAKTRLHLLPDIVLLEPVESLLDAAASQGTVNKKRSRNHSKLPSRNVNGDTYQMFLNVSPFSKVLYKLSFLHVLCEQLLLGVASAIIILVSLTNDDSTGFDVMWCQW